VQFDTGTAGQKLRGLKITGQQEIVKSDTNTDIVMNNLIIEPSASASGQVEGILIEDQQGTLKLSNTKITGDRPVQIRRGTGSIEVNNLTAVQSTTSSQDAFRIEERTTGSIEVTNSSFQDSNNNGLLFQDIVNASLENIRVTGSNTGFMFTSSSNVSADSMTIIGNGPGSSLAGVTTFRGDSLTVTNLTVKDVTDAIKFRDGTDTATINQFEADNVNNVVQYGIPLFSGTTYENHQLNGSATNISKNVIDEDNPNTESFDLNSASGLIEHDTPGLATCDFVVGNFTNTTLELNDTETNTKRILDPATDTCQTVP
jgi:hypothetical protein